MFKRIVITILNILFPPLAVALLCGFGFDLLVNCLLFLLAVIPSHVHGFYISFTYFNRKRKVRKGKYPGEPHGFIHSRKVNNGGASKEEVKMLKREMEEDNAVKRLSTRSNRRSRYNKVEDWDDGFVSPNPSRSSGYSAYSERSSRYGGNQRSRRDLY